jgi:hypothetical protein
VAVDRLELIWNYPMYLKMHTLRAHFFTQWGILDSVPRTELLKQQLIQQYAPQPHAGVDTTSVPLLQESEVVGNGLGQSLGQFEYQSQHQLQHQPHHQQQAQHQPQQLHEATQLPVGALTSVQMTSSDMNSVPTIQGSSHAINFDTGLGSRSYGNDGNVASFSTEQTSSARDTHLRSAVDLHDSLGYVSTSATADRDNSMLPSLDTSGATVTDGPTIEPHNQTLAPSAASADSTNAALAAQFASLRSRTVPTNTTNNAHCVDLMVGFDCILEDSLLVMIMNDLKMFRVC